MASEIQTVMLSPDLGVDKSVASVRPPNGPEHGVVRRFERQPEQVRNEENADARDPGERKQEVAKAVEDINSHLESLRRDLQFSVDDDSGSTVVKVVDPETDEVIRQIPAEEVLELRKRLEEAEGVIFRGEA